ncbi:TMV resistance protein N-like isoform X1 [Prunus yedoensis var. nudiflora]|uniref:TMV resistance protein N-like isoform X1 n=1 Tax=Prunus yedoensis var. nudiflora TaxID=2094558 RepID=A0A314YI90_PRUYE|nr:TMV resistance protein N-like isoform X1 [Prunus yedoensis var. nudiflora]
MSATETLWEYECGKGRAKSSWLVPSYLPTVRVHLVRISKAVKSCGVHLVMPPG